MRADPIQWYPGHMARAMRRLADDLKLIDVAIEVVDARVPFSGSNPQLQQIVVRKRRLLVLAREDLADPQTTARWLAHFELEGRAVVTLDVKRRAGLARLVRALTEVAGEGHGAQRAIVVGIPNAGKSTVINALAGRNVARVEDRAGVTRAPQWFRLGPTLEL
ncbi:MAG: YlqF/YawG GTPase family protein, partial [Vulcanimicrobiaceae bacterium]